MMFKRQLLKARQAAGKTQKEVALFIGVTESTYCGYERGKREPSLEKLKKIALYLGVSTDVLLEVLSQPKPKYDINVMCNTEEETHIIRQYRLLNDEGRLAITSAVDGIAANPLLKRDITKKVYKKP